MAPPVEDEALFEPAHRIECAAGEELSENRTRSVVPSKKKPRGAGRQRLEVRERVVAEEPAELVTTWPVAKPRVRA